MKAYQKSREPGFPKDALEAAQASSNAYIAEAAREALEQEKQRREREKQPRKRNQV